MHRKFMKFECLLVELLFVGIGAGASAVLFGEISRTTTQKERTAAFTVVIAISELGLIVGPALNLFLQHLDYKVGPFDPRQVHITGGEAVFSIGYMHSVRASI